MDAAFSFFYYDGSTADDFYYVLDPRGRKVYYTRRTGKRTSLERIPKAVVSSIKERPQNLDKAKLLQQKQAFLEQIKKLQQKVADIDKKLNGQDSFDYEAELKQEKIKEQEAQDRQKEERRKFFEKIYNQKNQQQQNNKKRKAEPAPIVVEEFLRTLKITTKKEWKQWLLENHPDKGGKDEALCQKVIEYGRTMGW